MYSSCSVPQEIVQAATGGDDPVTGAQVLEVPRRYIATPVAGVKSSPATRDSSETSGAVPRQIPHENLAVSSTLSSACTAVALALSSAEKTGAGGGGPQDLDTCDRLGLIGCPEHSEDGRCH
jgi:hypothetical protein